MILETKTYVIDEDTRLEVEFLPNLIKVYGYSWQDDAGREDEDDFEPAGVWCTLEERYIGYTLSECLCKALMEMGIAEDWEDAIPMVEDLGVPYETDEDDD
jgi:hypothetical protein